MVHAVPNHPRVFRGDHGRGWLDALLAQGRHVVVHLQVARLAHAVRPAPPAPRPKRRRKTKAAPVEPVLSEYELGRRAKIKRNNKFLVSVGLLFPPKEALEENLGGARRTVLGKFPLPPWRLSPNRYQIIPY